MTGLEIGLVSVGLIFLAIFVGMKIPIAFLAVSFGGIWIVLGDFDRAASALALSASDSIEDYLFGVIPLFVLMGIFVMKANLGRDSYLVANQVFRKVPGGLGLSTVGGNAFFASITGVSVASATVFSKIAIPEMLRYGYSARFATGVVAGSSVLGMLIPPSLLFIVFGILAEESIGKLFLGGVIPGLLLAVGFGVTIVVWAILKPESFGRGGGQTPPTMALLSPSALIAKIGPLLLLVMLVLGGLYGGYITPTESGALGAAGALLIALAKRCLGWRKFWDVLLQTGAVTTALMLLIMSANLYSRMLAHTGLPNQMGTWFAALDLGPYGLLAVFIIALLVLGCLMDSVSIILITVPLVLPTFKALDFDMVWLGVITVLTAEIGLLTPPFGILAFVVKSSIDDDSISLGDIFRGAFPFTMVMLVTVVILVLFPWLTTVLT